MIFEDIYHLCVQTMYVCFGSVPVQAQQLSADPVKTSSSSLNWFILKDATFSHKKYGHWRQEIIGRPEVLLYSLCQGWLVAPAKLCSFSGELRSWRRTTSGMGCQDATELAFLINPCLCPLHSQVRQWHIGDFFPCHYQGDANKPMGNHRLAIGTDISSAEDRKPHPTRSSTGLIFRTKSLRKILQPSSPTLHYAAVTSLPDTCSHDIWGRGNHSTTDPVLETSCWEISGFTQSITLNLQLEIFLA